MVILLCVFGLLCASAAAEGKGKKEKGKGKGKAKGGMAAVIDSLDLTDEQKPKVDELMAGFREKVKAAEAKEDKKAARQEFMAELEKVLTAEQMEKYREEMKKRRGKGKGKKKRKEAEE